MRAKIGQRQLRRAFGESAAGGGGQRTADRLGEMREAIGRRLVDSCYCRQPMRVPTGGQTRPFPAKWPRGPTNVRRVLIKSTRAGRAPEVRWHPDAAEADKFLPGDRPFRWGANGKNVQKWKGEGNVSVLCC